jgi:GT2 family glycosyltransferase
MRPYRPLLVITPTLGTSPWLTRTVTSVSTYAGEHAQHILVAPASTHDDLRKRFPHCEVVADTARTGVYAAINLGIAAAFSRPWDYFTWINDDDAFTPGFTRHLETALAYDGKDETWFYGGVRLRGPGDENLGRLPVSRFSSDIITLALIGINPLNQQGLLIPHSGLARIGQIREDLRICADVDLWLRGLKDGAKFRLTGHTVAEFRLRKGQISGDIGRHRDEFEKATRALFANAPGPLRALIARVRFRLGNSLIYLERLRRCGWRGGFDLLQNPVSGP